MNRKHRAFRQGGRTEGVPPRKPMGNGPYWVFGQHAVKAALANPERKVRRVVATAEAAPALAELAGDRAAVETVERRAIESHLPAAAVHQGVAALVEPLAEPTIDGVCAAPGPKIVVVLDRVTDPHNVGAIMRSAAVFGASAVVVTDRHAAPITGTLAKSASGALETVPLIRVVNLAQALGELKDNGFWCIGLDAEAPERLAPEKLGENIALVLGAEGEGLRRLTRERCDVLMSLSVNTGAKDEQARAEHAFTSLNVSNAAAIALYIVAQRKGNKG